MSTAAYVDFETEVTAQTTLSELLSRQLTQGQADTVYAVASSARLVELGLSTREIETAGFIPVVAETHKTSCEVHLAIHVITDLIEKKHSQVYISSSNTM